VIRSKKGSDAGEGLRRASSLLRVDEASLIVTGAARAAAERIAGEVWQHNELSLHEVRSAEVHLRELTDAGFTVTARGACGVPTAFVAEWTQGSGGASVGFLSEYDALPGLGNAAVPRRQPREDGQTNGHGCGHNLLGAALTAAAIAAKAQLEHNGVPGTLKVFGCAAEETQGVKVYMARAGLFSGLDACLHWHPAPFATVANVRTAAGDIIRIEFHGRSAHAGVDPWNGRSALDALELLAHAVNLMREHVEPTARLHYIFEAAGQTANVVPDYARMYLIVRDADRERIRATTAWIEQAARGAALSTQTEVRFEHFFGMHDILPNTPLAERMQIHLEAVGTPDWTDAEQEFARACQTEMGVEPAGLASGVAPLPQEPTMGGSSDVGDASWLAPTMGITMPTFPLGIGLHTWPVTACGGMSIGARAAVAAAEVLARTALDVLADETLRAAAHADFEHRIAGRPYVSPLPDHQQVPTGIPEWLTNDGSAETVHNLTPAVAP
jgi:aminobenzoyl-glutamate utilization protein B